MCARPGYVQILNRVLPGAGAPEGVGILRGTCRWAVPAHKTDCTEASVPRTKEQLGKTACIPVRTNQITFAKACQAWHVVAAQ